MEKITQTAGRDQLGGFAPEFAHYNDDILFGENWNNQDIDLKTRCMITVVALMASGITDSSLKYHLENAKAHGVTRPEMAAIVTHVGFYVGWPKAWAVFRMAKEVYADDVEQEQHGGFFGQGEPNTAYRQYFVGNSYLKPLTDAKDTSVFIASPRKIHPPAHSPERHYFVLSCSAPLHRSAQLLQAGQSIPRQEGAQRLLPLFSPHYT